MFAAQALLAKVNGTSSQDSKLTALSGPGAVAVCKFGVNVKVTVDGATFPAQVAGKRWQSGVCILLSYLPVP